MIRLAAALLLVLTRADGPAATQEGSLRDRIDAAVRTLPLKNARVGVLVHSTRAGATVYGSNEQEPLLLASNTKLLTTSAALDRLGSGFTFRTAAGLSGEDLHVFAGGDPNISGRAHDGDPAAVFKKWAGKIKDAGVARLGKIVLHTGIFDAAHLNPGWKDYDLWWWWSAPFGALSLNDNCVDLHVEPGRPGEPVKVTVAPETAYVKVVNLARSAAKPEKPFGFTRAPETNTITLRGETGAKATYWVAVHDPTMYFGTVLKETLQRAGIEVAGAIEESAAPPEEVAGFRELASWESGLAETLAVCNQPSQNFYAEMLLRTLGWKRKGKGSLENGLAVVAEFLREIGIERASQADGSGLTRENSASAADLVKLLLHMRAHKDAKIFLESLPANGAPKGTLRRRMLDDDLKGRVRAKTGHIAGVSALSGYVDSLGGDTYVFSILANVERGSSTAAADKLQDRICELLVRYKGD